MIPITPTFAPGTIVYSRDGHKARYLASSEEGHVVQPEMEVMSPDGESCDTYYDGVQIYNEVFTKPPREVLDKEIAELETKRRGLQDEVYKIKNSISVEEKAVRERLDKIKRYKGLEQLEDFIDGKITHYVVTHWSGVDILPFGATETTDKGEDWKRMFKMLVLFGDSKGELSWKLSDYACDSYCRQEVFPCTSEQAARDKAKELLEASYAEWRVDHNKGISHAIDSAKKLGLEVPADVTEYMNDMAIKSARRGLEEARALLATREANFTKLQYKDAQPVFPTEKTRLATKDYLLPPVIDDKPF